MNRLVLIENNELIGDNNFILLGLKYLLRQLSKIKCK